MLGTSCQNLPTLAKARGVNFGLPIAIRLKLNPDPCDVFKSVCRRQSDVETDSIPIDAMYMYWYLLKKPSVHVCNEQI